MRYRITIEFDASLAVPSILLDQVAHDAAAQVAAISDGTYANVVAPIPIKDLRVVSSRVDSNCLVCASPVTGSKCTYCGTKSY